MVVVGLFAFLTGLFQWDRDSLDSILCPLLPDWLSMGRWDLLALLPLLGSQLVLQTLGLGWGYQRRYGWWRYDGASQILRERYAKGEITKEQFDQMMRDLEGHG